MTQALIDEWKYCKEQEVIWSAKRIQTESKLYELNQHNLPDKGTHTTPEGMKITTGYTEKWDDAEVAKAYQSWPVESVKFPFETAYKPDGKAISVMRENLPELYKLLQPALTITPRKPAFSVKSE